MGIQELLNLHYTRKNFIVKYNYFVYNIDMIDITEVIS